MFSIFFSNLFKKIVLGINQYGSTYKYVQFQQKLIRSENIGFIWSFYTFLLIFYIWIFFYKYFMKNKKFLLWSELFIVIHQWSKRLVTAVSYIAQWCSGNLPVWTLFIGRNVHCTIITTLNSTWHHWIWVEINLMKRHGQWFVCLQNSLFSKWNFSVTLTELDQSFSLSCTICLKFILTLFLSNIINMLLLHML